LIPENIKALSLLLETIKIEDGRIYNLSYHQARFDKSRKALWGYTGKIDLSSFIQAPAHGLYRCRILYNEIIHSIEYIPYIPKEIKKLKIIPSNINYNYKYANRDALNTLLQKQTDCDEIIIEQNGYLTDTTIANIAFYDGERWVTPAKPLLKGTMRAKLLDEGLLHEKEIKKEDLKNYSQVALINAMIGFKILNDFTIKL
jgi:4-amino-4-deoxychorismate lyase